MDRLPDYEIAEMLDRAQDGIDHEWRWYEDDVPALIREIERLRGPLDPDDKRPPDPREARYEELLEMRRQVERDALERTSN